MKVRNKEGGWRRRQNYALTLIESLESTIRTTPSQPMLRPLTPNTTESSRCPTIAEWNILFLFVPSLMCLQYQQPIVRERVRVYVCEYFYLGNITSAFNCNWHKLLLFDAILIFFIFTSSSSSIIATVIKSLNKYIGLKKKKTQETVFSPSQY